MLLWLQFAKFWQKIAKKWVGKTDKSPITTGFLIYRFFLEIHLIKNSNIRIFLLVLLRKVGKINLLEYAEGVCNQILLDEVFGRSAKAEPKE